VTGVVDKWGEMGGGELGDKGGDKGAKGERRRRGP